MTRLKTTLAASLALSLALAFSSCTIDGVDEPSNVIGYKEEKCIFEYERDDKTTYSQIIEDCNITADALWDWMELEEYGDCITKSEFKSSLNQPALEFVEELNRCIDYYYDDDYSSVDDCIYYELLYEERTFNQVISTCGTTADYLWDSFEFDDNSCLTKSQFKQSSNLNRTLEQFYDMYGACLYGGGYDSVEDCLWENLGYYITPNQLISTCDTDANYFWDWWTEDLSADDFDECLSKTTFMQHFNVTFKEYEDWLDACLEDLYDL